MRVLLWVALQCPVGQRTPRARTRRSRGRPTAKLPTQPHRREMATASDRDSCGQRWQLESAFSQCKCWLGSPLRARRSWCPSRESLLWMLVHNLVISRCLMCLQQSKHVSFSVQVQENDIPWRGGRDLTQEFKCAEDAEDRQPRPSPASRGQGSEVTPTRLRPRGSTPGSDTVTRSTSSWCHGDVLGRRVFPPRRRGGSFPDRGRRSYQGLS